MIVRLLIWSLSDSKTTLDEVRAHLPESTNRTWISDETTERFGAVETWDDIVGDFPVEIRELIGKDPDIAEEFDVESSWERAE